MGLKRSLSRRLVSRKMEQLSLGFRRSCECHATVKNSTLIERKKEVDE